jgi:hypothetical protein
MNAYASLLILCVANAYGFTLQNTLHRREAYVLTLHTKVANARDRALVPLRRDGLKADNVL